MIKAWRFYVYAYFRPGEDLPFYVGKGCEKRCFEHWSLIRCGKKMVYNRFFSSSLERLLLINQEPIITVLAHFISEATAYDFEEALIKHYGRRIDGSGVLDNIDPGFRNRIGFKGKRHTEETKMKMKQPRSDATKQRMRKPKDEEHCKKLKVNGNNQHSTWTLLTPTGERIIVENLNQFCLSRDMNPTPIYRTLKTQRPVLRGSSKGWQATFHVSQFGERN